MSKQQRAEVILKLKRQQMGFSQKKLAELTDCAPSAICMFEKGKHEALSVERLNKVCEVLELEPGALLKRHGTFYCSNPLCPTHQPYAIGDEIALIPRAVTSSSREKFCKWCGELLVNECESCHASYNNSGAFCGECGRAYVSLPDGYTPCPASRNRLQLFRDERAAFAALEPED